MKMGLGLPASLKWLRVVKEKEEEEEDGKKERKEEGVRR